ncbi:hypothetical protein PCCS19_18460 [Paenibacillus sp. CCS19]|uniref:hypothetical protein n=1 Tax=Paenibacillus sp. CCS19 TaxID=3158387 RepID=UPI00256609DA|nr:hypothetical protein [Paenibacillus cellulosilyticus]GMK38792.1 hypothetical protein PCCS19_18460 [Paenibacillus cellulosilyticus]
MKRLYMYLILIVVVLAGCSRTSSEPSTEQSSYPDYVTVDGKNYLNAWELALIDLDGLKAIGKVEQSSVVPLGVPVYEIAGYPEEDVIAVKFDGHPGGLVANLSGYLIYVQQEDNGKSHYPTDIAKEPIKQIQIYRGSELLRELRNEEEVNAFLALFKQQGPFNEIQSERGTEYTVLLIGDGTFGFNYGVMVKDGHYGVTHTESKLPDEMAGYFK